jgi:hypothetical protein
MAPQGQVWCGLQAQEPCWQGAEPLASSLPRAPSTLMKNLVIVLAATALVACASAKPVLYGNETYQQTN